MPSTDNQTADIERLARAEKLMQAAYQSTYPEEETMPTWHGLTHVEQNEYLAILDAAMFTIATEIRTRALEDAEREILNQNKRVLHRSDAGLIIRALISKQEA